LCELREITVLRKAKDMYTFSTKYTQTLVHSIFVQFVGTVSRERYNYLEIIVTLKL